MFLKGLKFSLIALHIFITWIFIQKKEIKGREEPIGKEEKEKEALLFLLYAIMDII